MSEAILIGSGNRDKARELSALLSDLPFEVKSLADMPTVEEPVEDGETFEANALKKARYYARQFDMLCVADDSGLEVDALGGRPGVYSARYAGPGCTYADNNEKLLGELEETPWHERGARFVCVAAFASPGGEEHTERGTVEGHISIEAFGENGFGYDPVFVPKGHDKTFGEMKPEQKHELSHRGRAFAKLRTYLERRAS